MSGMAQRPTATAIAVSTLAAALAMAAAATAAGGNHGALSFSGSCRLSGDVTFKPGLSNRSRTIRQRVRAPGSCRGTFVDRRGATHQVDAAPATYVATEVAPRSSCAGGSAAGHGAVVSPYGRLRFHESETRAGAVVVATATGVRGGSAAGVAAPGSSADPTTLESCSSSGIKRVPIDITLTTMPRISG